MNIVIFIAIIKDISSGIINIISNNVDLIDGDLNAEYIRFDMGVK